MRFISSPLGGFTNEETVVEEVPIHILHFFLVFFFLVVGVLEKGKEGRKVKERNLSGNLLINDTISQLLSLCPEHFLVLLCF